MFGSFSFESYKIIEKLEKVSSFAPVLLCFSFLSLYVGDNLMEEIILKSLEDINMYDPPLMGIFGSSEKLMVKSKREVNNK